MKQILTILLIGFLFSCATDDSTEQESDAITSDDSAEAEAEQADTSEIENDSRVYYTIEVPGPTADEACFPYPSDEFIAQIEGGKVPNYGWQASYLYSYVVAHFDSLEARQYVEMEDEWDMGVYDWSQAFSDGLSYTEYFGGEGGSTATIYTSCSNFEAVHSTINALVNYKYLDADWEYDGSWNEERDHYAPTEGVGCFYHISLDDSTNYYKVENYCGC